jgi:DNA-binding PucR family transcriptional regulator
MDTLPPRNRYRDALELLQRSRDQIVDQITDQILDGGDDLLDQGYLFHEFLENQGTRLHFLTLLASQIEQSADLWDETRVKQSLTPVRKTSARPRRRKPVEPAPETESRTDES